MTGRRPDGYHLLDSLTVFAGVGDVLRAEVDATIGLSIDGPFAAGLSAGEDNLVHRAALRLAGSEHGVTLRLTKNLPVASGIGGGSADAAAALRILARLWGIEGDLGDTALALGADVPVCLASRPARMGGIGERLAPAPRLPRCGIVLVNPGLAVSTPDVFRARSGSFSSPARLPAAWADAGSMAKDLGALRNDLEDPAIGLCTVIQVVIEAIGQMPGCLLARMSGSGATCFGLFASDAEAAVAAALLERPGWWCWGGPLYERG